MPPQKVLCSAFQMDRTTYPFFFSNNIVCTTSCIITSFATFSLFVEAAVVYGSLIEYATIALSFAIVIFGITTLVCCSVVSFALSRRRFCLLVGVRSVFKVTLLVELAVFAINIAFGAYSDEFTYDIEDWMLFIKYYQEEQIRADLDMIQKQLMCCGFKSYQDWDLNPYYSCNSTGYSRCSVPYSCCRLDTPDSSCVLGIRNPDKSTAKLKESIYLDGCLKTSQIWYRYTIILLSCASFLMIVLKVFIMYGADQILSVQMESRNQASKSTRIPDLRVCFNDQQFVSVSKLDTLVKHAYELRSKNNFRIELPKLNYYMKVLDESDTPNGEGLPRSGVYPLEQKLAWTIDGD